MEEEDVLLQELLASFAAGSAQQDLPELNLIGGFVGRPQPRQVEHPGGPSIDGTQQFQPYYEGADVEMLTRMNTEELARFQDAIVANGLAREVIPGRIDDSTVNAMSSLMALGNRQTVRWQEVLDGVIRSGGLSGSNKVEEFEPRTRLKPDYATLAQDVKETFRKRLGRDPDTYEMQQLTSELTGFHAIAAEAQNELDRIQFDQANTPGVQDGGTVSAVDPMSRFAEMFESKYKSELDFVEDKEDAQVSRQVVQSGADTLSQMSRRA